MIETITIAKDQSHLLIIHKEDITEESTNPETNGTPNSMNPASVNEESQSKPVFTLQVIPLVSNQKIIFDLDYKNKSIKNCRCIKDAEDMVAYEIEHLQQQSLHQIENINVKFTEPSSSFIVIVDIESGYQEVTNARYPLNKSISNIFDETSFSESIAISVDKTNERDHQLVIDLIRVVDIEEKENVEEEELVETN